MKKYSFLRDSLWGDRDEEQIEEGISHIESIASLWDADLSGVVFIFTMTNNYKWVCSQYYTSCRRLVVNSNEPKLIDTVNSFNPYKNTLEKTKIFNFQEHDRNLPLLMINGSVVDTSLLAQAVPYKFGTPCNGIYDTFLQSLPQLELTYELCRTSELDDHSKLKDLPIMPSKAFIIPKEELQKLRDILGKSIGDIDVESLSKTDIDRVYSELVDKLPQKDEIWNLVKHHRTVTNETINPNTQFIRIVRAISQGNLEMNFFDYAELVQDMRNQTTTPTYENLSVANAYMQISSVCQQFVSENGKLIPLSRAAGRRAARQSDNPVQRISRREIAVLDMDVVNNK